MILNAICVYDMVLTETKKGMNHLTLAKRISVALDLSAAKVDVRTRGWTKPGLGWELTMDFTFLGRIIERSLKRSQYWNFKNTRAIYEKFYLSLASR